MVAGQQKVEQQQGDVKCEVKGAVRSVTVKIGAESFRRGAGRLRLRRRRLVLRTEKLLCFSDSGGDVGGKKA